ncbi:hypothetical protein PFISCL1PPCAC_28824, partial [Pristionchus fissidentatus]
TNSCLHVSVVSDKGSLDSNLGELKLVHDHLEILWLHSDNLLFRGSLLQFEISSHSSNIVSSIVESVHLTVIGSTAIVLVHCRLLLHVIDLVFRHFTY